MARKSAGILLYRFVVKERLEVLIVHPGGPYWANKDNGVWSIPKGEFSDNEDPLEAALREFQEETGVRMTSKTIELTPVKLHSGKVLYPFAAEGEFDTTTIKSNTFMLEWPPKSGQQVSFPEVDRAAWVDLSTARQKLPPEQYAILLELSQKLMLR